MTPHTRWARLRRWAGALGLVAALAAVTWWLLTRGTRGAEIATVLALPIAGIGVLVALAAIRVPSKELATTDGAEEGQWLVIDDVIVGTDARNVTLDVRIRNAGTGTVNLTRLDLHTHVVAAAAASYEPSATYDLVISETSDHNEMTISHALQPGEVDNFIVRIGFRSLCAYSAELLIIYNGTFVASYSNMRFRAPV